MIAHLQQCCKKLLKAIAPWAAIAILGLCTSLGADPLTTEEENEIRFLYQALVGEVPDAIELNEAEDKLAEYSEQYSEDKLNKWVQFAMDLADFASYRDRRNAFIAYKTSFDAYVSPTEFEAIAAGRNIILDPEDPDEIVDDHGDTADTATPIDLNSRTEGLIWDYYNEDSELVEDIDFFQFRVTEDGTAVSIFGTWTLSGGSFRATLLDKDEKEVAVSEGGRYDDPLFIIVQALDIGTYYIKIEEFTSDFYAGYSLFLQTGRDVEVPEPPEQDIALSSTFNLLLNSQYYIEHFGEAPSVSDPLATDVFTTRHYRALYGEEPTPQQIALMRSRYSVVGGDANTFLASLVRNSNIGGTPYLNDIPLDPSQFYEGGYLQTVLTEERVSDDKVEHLSDLTQAELFREIMSSTAYESRISQLSLSAFTVKQKLSQGWAHSSWLGLVNGGQRPWIFTQDLGWVYERLQGDGNWFYHEQFGWLWTKRSLYPYLYSVDLGWLYAKGKQLYHFDSETWLSIDQFAD